VSQGANRQQLAPTFPVAAWWPGRTITRTRGAPSNGEGVTRLEKGKGMNFYRKPVIVDLGSVMDLIRGTLIKGHRGIIEAIHWRIIPAYDLDE
jgi:hypothetical protein